MGFYSALAEDLASRGYVVVGVDHPFQVAAVAIGDGSVAVYDHSQDLSLGSIEQKIEERVADVEFVLDRIRAGDEEVGFLTAGLDLDRIGVLGHSNGGLTALETCRADAEVLACLNIDGQGAGGPFGHERGATAPEQPFMYLTKETSIHPELNRRFETAGEEAVRAVIPGAAHSDFTDGGLFEPGLDPLGGRVRDVAVSVRSLAGAFFDQWLKEPRTRPYSGLDIPSDVYINVYPLGGSPPIPVAPD